MDVSLIFLPSTKFKEPFHFFETTFVHGCFFEFFDQDKIQRTISLKSWFFEFFAQYKIQRTISLKLFLCKKYSGSEVMIIPEGGAGALMIHTVIAMIAMKLRGIAMIALIAPVVLPMSAKG